MPGGLRSTAGPVDDKKLAGLIEPVVVAAGMDLESVRLSVAGRRRLLRITVDSDHGVSLDDAADVSRDVAALLDASNALGEVPYTLEVSSPGVDRPLTQPRHWRRSRGRLVKVKVSGEGTLEGRVLAADADGITLDLASGERRFPYASVGAGSVQVEFGRIPDAELDNFSDPDFDDAVPEDAVPEDAVPDDTVLDDTVSDEDTDLGAGSDGH